MAVIFVMLLTYFKWLVHHSCLSINSQSGFYILGKIFFSLMNALLRVNGKRACLYWYVGLARLQNRVFYFIP